jgi:hypothetical protein
VISSFVLIGSFDWLRMSGERAMTAKIGEAKRRAFLKAYARSGNLTLSAEEAGVSRSWVSLTRRSDPAFDAQCRAAKAASAERLAASGCNRPPAAWKRRGGIELVVQRSGRRAPQVVRSPGSCWTPRSEGRFLGMLRQCNNLRLACQWAGLTLSSYEAHWRRWPDFRRRVSEARAFAGAYLDALCEAERGRSLDFEDWPEPGPEPSIARRIRLARRHKGRG